MAETTSTVPVIVVHLTDALDPTIAVCSGVTVGYVGAEDYPTTPRELCQGCLQAVKAQLGG